MARASLRSMLVVRFAFLLCVGGWLFPSQARAAAPAAEAGSKPTPAGLERVPADAPAFISVRLASLWNSPSIKKLRAQLPPEVVEDPFDLDEKLGLKPTDIERLTLVLLDTRSREGTVLLVGTVDKYDRAVLHKKLGAGPEIKQREISFHSIGEGVVLHHFSDRLFAIGPEASVFALATKAPRGDGALTSALNQAREGGQIVGAANLAAQADLLRELASRRHRDEFSVVGVYDMLLDLHHLGLQVDCRKGVRLELNAKVNNEKQAQEFEKILVGGQAYLKYRLSREIARPEEPSELPRRGRRQPREMDAKERELLNQIAYLLNKVTIRRDGDFLTLAARLDDLETAKVSELQALLVNSFMDAQLRQKSNNLQQILIAVHNWDSTYGKLPPPAVYSKAGKPLLSWRVLLLPYMEQQNLYRQFKLDEPWDSEHNKKLLPLMPKVYALPRARDTKDGITHYRTIGKFGPLGGNFKAGALFNWENTYTLANIPDGTSNTILIVEAEEGVPWTKPDELDFDPMNRKSVLPKLGKISRDRFQVGMMDGSVRWVGKKVSEQTLRFAFSPNDGVPLGADWEK